MSSGGSSVPKPPDPYETSMDSIKAQIDSLPKILAAQKKYGGQFTAEELKILQEYGPQFAQTQMDIAGITSPQSVAAQKLLASEFERPVDELLTAGEAQQFRSYSRAATSVRGLGESGFGALEEIQGLTALRQNLKMQRLNLALGATGGMPQSSSYTQQGQISPGQLVQNVNPSQIFGLAQSNYSTQMQGWQTQQQGKSDLWGSLIGAGGAIAGAAVGSMLMPGVGTAAGAAAGGAAATTWV